MWSVRCFPTEFFWTVLSVPIVNSYTQNIKYSVQKHVIFLIHTLCLSGVVSYSQCCIEVGIIYARTDAYAVHRTRSQVSRAQNEISYALCSAMSASCCGWEYTINLTIRGATDHVTKAKDKKREEKKIIGRKELFKWEAADVSEAASTLQSHYLPKWLRASSVTLLKMPEITPEEF